MNLPWLESARAELGRNPRLRLGLLVIGLLVVLYALGGLSEVRRSLADTYSQRNERLVRVMRVAHEKGWERRAGDARRTRKALEAEIPDADSVGLAQATVQGWLRDTLNAVHSQLSVSMGQPQRVDAQHDYWRIPAQINGGITPPGALQLLQLIEKRKELITVDSIRLTTGSNAMLTLSVNAYYRVKGGDKGDATSAP